MPSIPQNLNITGSGIAARHGYPQMAVPSPRPRALTKLISLDGLVGWDNRVFEDHRETIYRHVLVPLRATAEMSDPLASTGTYRRAYRFVQNDFDAERGVFVNTYREIFEGR